MRSDPVAPPKTTESTVPVIAGPSGAPRSRLRNRLARIAWRDPKTITITLVVVIVAYLAVLPLIYLVWGSFFDETGFTLDAFRRAYSGYDLGTLTANTMVFAVGATVVAVVLGTGLAYLTERTNVPFKSLVFAMALVPLIIPGILYAISWIFIAGPRTGVVNVWFRETLNLSATFDVFSLPGMVLVQGLENVPLVFLLMVAAFRSMDPSLEESALMGGARFGQVIRRITLPLAMPGIVAATLIVTVRNMEAFEVPAILGTPNGIWVFTTRIWRMLDHYPADYGQAGAYSISLIVLVSIVIFLQTKLTSGSTKYQTVTGKGFRPRRMDLRRAKYPIGIVVALYSLVAVVLPTAMLLYMSVQPYNRPPTLQNLAESTLRNYQIVFDQRETVRAFVNSLILGVGAATVVMVLTTIAAWLVIRTKVRGRWIVDNFTFLPLLIPGLVLGVALLFMYLRSPIPVYGTLWILLIAYVTRFMPYGMRYAAASMYQIANELEESALMSGATWGQVIRRIVLPLLTPGLVAGWVYVMLVAVREFAASLLLYSAGTEVLSIRIWQLWQDGDANELAALGVVMVSVMVVLVIIAQKVGAKVGYQGA